MMSRSSLYTVGHVSSGHCMSTGLDPGFFEERGHGGGSNGDRGLNSLT